MKIVAIHGLAGSGKDTFADWLVAHRGFVKLSLAAPMKEFVAATFAVPHEWLYDSSELRKSLINTSFPTPMLKEDWGPVRSWAQYVAGDKSMAGDKLVEWVESMAQRHLVPLREILQTLGTEWGRTIDADLWVKLLVEKRLPAVCEPAWFGWQAKWGGLPMYPRTSFSAYSRSDFSLDTVLEFVGVQGVVVPDVRFKNELRVLQQVEAPFSSFKIQRPWKAAAPLPGGIAGHVSEAGLSDELFDAVLDVPEGLERLPFLFEAVYERFVR